MAVNTVVRFWAKLYLRNNLTYKGTLIKFDDCLPSNNITIPKIVMHVSMNSEIPTKTWIKHEYNVKVLEALFWKLLDIPLQN
jgi:hypothetical protein